MQIKLDLDITEVKMIVDALGELPTKTGAWILGMKLDELVKEQIPKEDKAE